MTSFLYNPKKAYARFTSHSLGLSVLVGLIKKCFRLKRSESTKIQNKKSTLTVLFVLLKSRIQKEKKLWEVSITHWTKSDIEPELNQK